MHIVIPWVYVYGFMGSVNFSYLEPQYIAIICLIYIIYIHTKCHYIHLNKNIYSYFNVHAYAYPYYIVFLD